MHTKMSSCDLEFLLTDAGAHAAASLRRPQRQWQHSLTAAAAAGSALPLRPFHACLPAATAQRRGCAHIAGAQGENGAYGEGNGSNGSSTPRPNAEKPTGVGSDNGDGWRAP